MRSVANASKVVNPWTPQSLLAVMKPMWPAPLSENAARLMLERGRVARFNSGDVIARQGSTSRGMYLVLAGQAEIVSLRSTGRELMRYILGPGEAYSFLHIYHSDPHTSSLVARGACEVLVLTRQNWLNTTDECPELKDAVIAIVTHRLRGALEVLESNNFASGIARLAHRLLWHIRKTPTFDSPDPTGQPHFDVQLTQVDLAKMLSLSRQRTNALLHQLENKGVIALKYGHILVHDLESLRRVAASNDID